MQWVPFKLPLILLAQNYALCGILQSFKKTLFRFTDCSFSSWIFNGIGQEQRRILPPISTSKFVFTSAWGGEEVPFPPIMVKSAWIRPLLGWGNGVLQIWRKIPVLPLSHSLLLETAAPEATMYKNNVAVLFDFSSHQSSMSFLLPGPTGQ